MKKVRVSKVGARHQKPTDYIKKGKPVPSAVEPLDDIDILTGENAKEPEIEELKSC